jgi:Glycosyltransferase family 10 (fucosyltransferase) C-term
MKKTLKLSIPGAPLELSLDPFKDLNNDLFNNWEIFVNDLSIQEADCWFVIEDVSEIDNICEVSPENIVFLAAETAQPVSHIEESSYMKTFLAQFGKVFTFHQYSDARLVSSIPFLPWMINSNHGESIWAEHERNVDFFLNLQSPEKTKLISVICSRQDLTENHRMRIRFVQQLKSHFGDSLDWYGNGIESVSEKWTALAPYRYTIVLENQSRYNVVTEKIGDAYLAHTYPIYWGAPNIYDFFTSDSLTVINIEDLEGSIEAIEAAISLNLADKRQLQLRNSRRFVLRDLNFVSRILKIADELVGTTPQTVRLFSQAEMKKNPTHSIKLKSRLISLLDRLDRAWNTNFSSIAKECYILLRYNNLSKQLAAKKKLLK